MSLLIEDLVYLYGILTGFRGYYMLVLFVLCQAHVCKVQANMPQRYETLCFNSETDTSNTTNSIVEINLVYQGFCRVGTKKTVKVGK